MDNSNFKKTLRRLSIVFFIVIILFGIINANWYFGYRRTYDLLSKDMELLVDQGNDDKSRFIKEVGDYIFLLKKPSYLGEGGFISVSKSEGYVVIYDKDNTPVSSNGMSVTLFLWPKRYHGYKIGIDLHDMIENIWEQIVIDETLTVISDNNMDDELIYHLQQLINEYSSEIEELLQVSQEVFKIP